MASPKPTLTTVLEKAQAKCKTDMGLDKKTIQDIENMFSGGEDALKYLSKERIKKIEKALKSETVQTICLEKLNEEQQLLLAETVVDIIIFVLEIIGFHVPSNDKRAVKKAIDRAIKEINKAYMIEDIENIKDSIDDLPDLSPLASSIFQLICDCIVKGIFYPIVKDLFNDMSSYDWFMTCAKIIAFTAIGPVGDIALIILKLDSAVKFIEKLKKLKKLKLIRDLQEKIRS